MFNYFETINIGSKGGIAIHGSVEVKQDINELTFALMKLSVLNFSVNTAS